MGSLAARTVGLPGQLGQVGSVVSQFAIGSLTTAGVFAGIAALGFAFKKLGEEAREAREEAERSIDEFVSLDPLGRQARVRTFQGRRDTEQQIRELEGRIAVGGYTRTFETASGDVRTRFIPFTEEELDGFRETIRRNRQALEDHREAVVRESHREFEQIQSAREARAREEERIRELTEEIGRMSVEVSQLDFSAMDAAFRKAAIVGLGPREEEEPVKATDTGVQTMPDRATRGPTSAKDLGVLTPEEQQMIREHQANAEELAKAGAEFDKAGTIAVASLGAMGEAAVLNSDKMEQAVLGAFTNILQSLPGVGGPFGALIGAVGGILGAALGKRDRGPVPVSVSDVSNRAASKLRDDAPPPNFQVFIDGVEATDEQLRRLGMKLSKLERKQGITRI